MKLRYERFTIHPKAPFAIARSTTTAYERVRVALTDHAGIEGWGEAAPNVFYKETADTVVAALDKLAPIVDRSRGVESLHDADVLEEWMHAAVPGDASARSAVSAAAHDLLGKKQNVPVWRLYIPSEAHAPSERSDEGRDLQLPLSSFTIAISLDEHELQQRVEDAAAYPILKVKLGSDHDEWIVKTVKRAAPTKTIRVDANAAWTLEVAKHMAGFLADHGVELLEQPLAKDDIAGMRALRRVSPIPIIADESCIVATDIPRLHDAVHGINIKLSKCGGLAEARRMVDAARRAHLKVMLGCMIESSLGITAAAHLAPLVDYADLDGAALLSDDPYVGATIERGVIRLPTSPGLGVTRKL